ncbi:hypothetical protein [Streptomyces jumonjinensis]|uniref:hypothetical protein n=1 Tax=Streptomyces jumonjinensis TaxID=1945 RepID=UPI00379B8DB2
MAGAEVIALYRRAVALYVRAVQAMLRWWTRALTVACVVEDALATRRDRRLTAARTKALLSSERTAALARVRQGCTHTPVCPSRPSPDRTLAAVVWEDEAHEYLCNGLVLAIGGTAVPDFPPAGPGPSGTPVVPGTRVGTG